jgi:hypothetical protein
MSAITVPTKFAKIWLEGREVRVDGLPNSIEIIKPIQLRLTVDAAL